MNKANFITIVVTLCVITLILFGAYRMFYSIMLKYQNHERTTSDYIQHTDLPPPAFPIAETTDLVTSDLPGDNDEFREIGTVSNDVMIVLDVTSGKYDEKTSTSNFLMLSLMPPGYQSSDNQLIAVIAQRTILECAAKRFRIVNSTAVDDQGNVVDFIVFPKDNWRALNEKTMGTLKHPTAFSIIVKLSCPSESTETI